MSIRSDPLALTGTKQGAAHALVGGSVTEAGSSPRAIAIGAAGVRNRMNRHRESAVRVVVLSGGTTVPPSSANGLSGTFQSLLAERGEPCGCSWPTPVSLPQGPDRMHHRR
jgi:hypothetical protein